MMLHLFGSAKSRRMAHGRPYNHATHVGDESQHTLGPLESLAISTIPSFQSPISTQSFPEFA